MAVKNKFLYNARWESTGIDCEFCENCQSPIEWPDLMKTMKCKKHNISLMLS